MGDDNLTHEIQAAKKTNYGGPELENMEMIVTAINHKNGWFDKDRTFGEDIALLHSECSEMLEAYRNWSLNDATNLCPIISASDNSEFDGHNNGPGASHICKPEGVGSEAADVLVRLLDTCERYQIDLVTEFWRKVEYNATRPYRHGNRAL